jgi:tRNA(fMet)-specific endonuclease VapC
MTYLLDANTCIKFLNGQSESVRQRFESLPFSDLALCSIVKSELFYGAMKSARPRAYGEAPSLLRALRFLSG